MGWNDWARAGWDFEPTVVIGCTLFLAWYVARTRCRPWPRLLACLVGLAFLLIALISPIDSLAEHSNFSAHMTQHVLLLDFAAPLLLLAIPGRLFRQWLAHPRIARIERFLRRPLIAWIVGFGALALWHWPQLYDLAYHHVAVHVTEHLCFLVSAVIFWWPILSPLAASRMPGWAAGFYLFSRTASDIVLGTLIALSPLGAYAGYINDRDIRLGGVLMWIPSVILDMGAIPFILAFASAQPYAPPAMDRTGTEIVFPAVQR